MFTVTPNGPNRVDIEFSGKLDSDEMKIALDELASKTQDIENGRMLYRVGDFQLPTLGAIGVELSRLPAMFGLIRKFDRCAVLADKKWIKTVSQIEGALIPGLEIKGFGPDQEAEAEAWLAGD
ncbi:MAG: STAS/SEC14 domain-containing protein [Gammaproteobacteria bacterium]|nr:STAS/SEC14 domain-containing protein [Gammaproteobacteria bacterium]